MPWSCCASAQMIDLYNGTNEQLRLTLEKSAPNSARLRSAFILETMSIVAGGSPSARRRQSPATTRQHRGPGAPARRQFVVDQHEPRWQPVAPA